MQAPLLYNMLPKLLGLKVLQSLFVYISTLFSWIGLTPTGRTVSPEKMYKILCMLTFKIVTKLAVLSNWQCQAL
jgi:hypothetical protein